MKKVKNYNITEALHSITQKGYKVIFTRDFTGSMTVVWGAELDKHNHIGIPEGSLKDLEKELSCFLVKLNEELE